MDRDGYIYRVNREIREFLNFIASNYSDDYQVDSDVLEKYIRGFMDIYFSREPGGENYASIGWLCDRYECAVEMDIAIPRKHADKLKRLMNDREIRSYRCVYQTTHKHDSIHHLHYICYPVNPLDLKHLISATFKRIEKAKK